MNMPIDQGPIAEGSWTARLIKWCLDAGIGDGGERPRLEIEMDGDGRWRVDAFSFSDGCATGCHAGTLEAAAEEAFARVSSHPERERESKLASAARALASVARVSNQRAREMLDDLLARLGSDG